MVPPSTHRALGTATRFLVAALMLGAVARVVRLRQAGGRAAAHRRGHILGLPHSADPADVMYPGNTALTPSANDRRAIAALYALPNGARNGSEP